MDHDIVHKVTVLPQNPQPNALYFVLSGQSVDLYVTSKRGEPRLLWNGSRIQAVVEAAMAELGYLPEWNSIVGRPQSSPAQIDSAVQSAHNHDNLDVLTQLNDRFGRLIYRGETIEPEPVNGFDGGHF